MKRSDRRYAMLIGGDGQTSNKGEHRRKGLSSRLQYHTMLSMDNKKNRKWHEKSVASKKLSFENTWAHIDIPKYKRHYITESNMEMVSNHFGELIPDWFKQTDLKRCSGYYDSSRSVYAWRPIYFEENIQDLKIYYTVVNMIDYCEQLLSKFPNSPSEIQMAILEIQDSYALLSLHIELKSTFTDTALEHYEEDVGFLSPREMYDPIKGPCFSISELPDVLKYVPYIPFWSEDEEINTDNLLVKRLVFLLGKCLPYPYRRRSVENAIVESWSDMMQRIFLKNSDKNDIEKQRMEEERKYTKDIYHVTIRVLMACLLGIYDHCEQRASLQARRRVYKWFCMCMPNQESFGLWILKYKEFVLCAFREWLFVMIDEVGGLSDFLSESSYWDVLKYSTYKMMDKARSDINIAMTKYSLDYTINDLTLESLWTEVDQFCLLKHSELDTIYKDEYTFDWVPGMPWFYKVQHDLDAVNRNILKNANRPKTHTFEKMGLLKMDEIEAELKKKKRINYNSIDPDMLQEGVKGYIQFSIQSCEQFAPISYTWLGDYPVNFSPALIADLQEAEDAYEYEAGASDMKKVFEDMYSNYPYEYQVIKWYFKCIVQKHNMLIYTAPKDMYDKQMKTFSEKLHKPDSLLPKCVGLYYVCYNCGNMKITVRDVSQMNNPNSLGGWTSEGVCINLDNGGFYCTHMYSRDTPKKRNPTKAIMNEIISKNEQDKADDMEQVIAVGAAKRFMNLEDIKDLRRIIPYQHRASLDKYIDRRETQERCLNTLLKPVYLPGKMVKTKNEVVVDCPGCLHPVAYSRNMFRNGIENMSCGCKDKKSEADFMCYICGVDCHEYCFVKAVWDDSSELQEGESPLKFICLCEDHRNKWTTKEDYIIKVSQLDREAKTKKNIKVKVKGDGKFVVKTESKKRPRAETQKEEKHTQSKQPVKKDPPAKKHKNKTHDKIDKKMREFKAKNKSVGKPLYKL